MQPSTGDSSNLLQLISFLDLHPLEESLDGLIIAILLLQQLLQVTLPKYRVTAHHHSFVPLFSCLWNCLPEAVQYHSTVPPGLEITSTTPSHAIPVPYPQYFIPPLTLPNLQYFNLQELKLVSRELQSHNSIMSKQCSYFIKDPSS